MDYPIWTVPYLGGAMVIAIIAIVHVFIVYFAIGAGIFNALTETFALKNHNHTLRQFLRDNSRLIILLPFIGGVVTGVGIWFSIALVSPETTVVLIHLFLWAWGYIYYYTWDRLSARSHCFVGWVYAIAALMSLLAINGILSFMLSPAALDSSKTPFAFDFWPAFFNPTYWPSLILRGIASLALAAIFAFVLVNASKNYDQTQRDTVVRYAGRFLLPLILMVPVTGWFFLCSPPAARFYVVQGGSIVMVMFFAFAAVAYILIALYSYIAIIYHRRSINLETSLLLLALALITIGAAEFIREGIRKPYLIWNHLYSNGLIKSQLQPLKDQLSKMDRADATVLKFSPWAIKPQHAHISDEDFYSANPQTFNAMRDSFPGKIKRGRWIYDAQCLRCHCIDGYNAVRPLVHHWSYKLTNYSLRYLDELKPSMPPFIGTIRDREDISHYLHSLNGTCTDCHENTDDVGNLLDKKKKITLKPDWQDSP